MNSNVFPRELYIKLSPNIMSIRGVRHFLCGPTGCCAVTEDIDKDCTYQKFEEVDNSSCFSGCSKIPRIVKSPRYTSQRIASKSETELQLADFIDGTQMGPLYSDAQLKISFIDDNCPQSQKHTRKTNLGSGKNLPDLALVCCDSDDPLRTGGYVLSGNGFREWRSTSKCARLTPQLKSTNGNELSKAAIVEVQKLSLGISHCAICDSLTTSRRARIDSGDNSQPQQCGEGSSYDSREASSRTVSLDSDSDIDCCNDEISVHAVKTKRSRPIYKMLRRMMTLKKWAP